MILINRKYNNDRFWTIGRIDHDDINEWYWNCFDVRFGEYEEIYSQGIAVDRADAEYQIRKEWREQLKNQKQHG